MFLCPPVYMVTRRHQVLNRGESDTVDMTVILHWHTLDIIPTIAQWIYGQSHITNIYTKDYVVLQKSETFC